MSHRPGTQTRQSGVPFVIRRVRSVPQPELELCCVEEVDARWRVLAGCVPEQPSKAFGCDSVIGTP
jgi:hypothetical protein